MPRKSNPMPTMGALFITNPRRKNPMATRRRRNGLALRRNGALNHLIAKKIKVNIQTAGGREAVKQFKRTPAYKKWAASAATKKALEAGRKAKTAKTAKKRVYKKKHGTSKAAQFYSRVGGSKSRSKRKTSSGGKGKSAYNKFVSARFAAARKAGVETSMGQIADEWARKKAGKSPSPAKKRRSTAKKKVATSRGRKQTGTMKNGRKWYKVDNKFVTAAAYKRAKANPSRRRRNPTRRRRNGMHLGALALRKNQGLPFVGTVAGAVDKIPVVGPPVAEFIPSLAVAGVSGAGVLFLHKFAEDKGFIPTWADPYQYTMVGVGGALATLAIPVGNLSTRRNLAAGMAMLGAGFDLFNYFQSKHSDSGAIAAMEAAANGEMGALALRRNRGYGAYEYTGGALNNPGYGALAMRTNPAFRGPVHPEVSYGGGHDLGSAEAAGSYMDAEMADASACPSDFSVQEAQVLMMGPAAHFQAFGKPAHSMLSKQSGGMSKHAGKPGHRWGWMVKLIGFKGMQQLCSMDAASRKQYIAQLKSYAIQSLSGQSQNVVPMEPSVFEQSGAEGAHGLGGMHLNGMHDYGAFMYKGGAL